MIAKSQSQNEIAYGYEPTAELSLKSEANKPEL